MDRQTSGEALRFRLWIVAYRDWRPTHWSQLPPRAVAVEPVEEGLYSADEAALFVEGFNQSMLSDDRGLWAVAVPVAVRYEGDATVGMPVRGYHFGGPPAEHIASTGGTTVGPAPSSPLEIERR